MAPSNLQGLNIVHPVQAHSDPHDLLSGQFQSDLSAQLDLWTNLAFDCDDGNTCPPNHEDEKYSARGMTDEDEEELSSHGSGTGEAAIHDGHINVVTGTNVGPNLGLSATSAPPPPHGLDLNAFLAGFPFPPPGLPNVPHPTAIAPSLAQLLAHYSATGAHHAFPGLPLHSVPLPVPSATHPPALAAIRHSLDDSSPPAAKRARARKASVSTVDSPTAAGAGEDLPQGVSAAEDKRRRNTAASARFRLKKKEREAALESKAKELEARVNELERECEGLRRENGWLKGLVVGVTGAAQAPVVTTSTKRSRDESEST